MFLITIKAVLFVIKIVLCHWHMDDLGGWSPFYIHFADRQKSYWRAYLRMFLSSMTQYVRWYLSWKRRWLCQR